MRSGFFLILVGIALSMAGDVFLKKSALTNYPILVIGILFYALGAIPVAIAFQKIGFGVVFLIWQAVTVIVALVIASLLFKESFTVYKAIALLFALGALYFSYLK